MASFSPADVRASICRESFEDFVRHFWNEVPGAGKCKWNWHLSVFCQELQIVAERVFKGLPKLYDLVINVSPGTSKSTIISILFPTWIWTRFPEGRVLSASHTDSLVLDLSTKARSVILSDKYCETFPEVELRHDQDTKGYYANTRGGDRYTCTVAGKSPMGFHAHFLIIDDPIDPKKALSEAETKTAKEFVTEVVSNRKVDKLVTPTILVMQRLGVGDPTDVMLDEGKKEGASPVRHICLPAELTRGDDGAFIESDVVPQELARRYVNGLMDPVRMPAQVLNENKARGALFYATQFLQRPYSRSGGMFMESYFLHTVKAAPYKAKRVRFWDNAATQAGGCNTAGVLMSRDGNEDYFVEHVVKGQWDPDERNKRILFAAQQDRRRYGPNNEPTIWVEQEPGSAGVDAFKYLAKVLRGYPIRAWKPTGKKEIRARPWSSQLAAGNVHLVTDGTWDVDGFIKEHLAFPLGAFKDQVDAAAAAFSLLVKMESSYGMRTFAFNKRKDGHLQFLVLDQAELLNTRVEEKSLLVSIGDPMGPDDVPGHALTNLLGSLRLRFTAHEPSDHQDNYGEIIEPYGQSVADLVLQRSQAKRLWAFLLQKRDPKPEIVVIQDEGTGIALTLAQAISDCLSLPRTIIVIGDDPEQSAKGEPLSRHIYDTVKVMRGAVI